MEPETLGINNQNISASSGITPPDDIPEDLQFQLDQVQRIADRNRVLNIYITAFQASLQPANRASRIQAIQT